jgi:hypothetical protein
MANIVNKANFTIYPKVMQMISRCERLHEEASEHLQTQSQAISSLRSLVEYIDAKMLTAQVCEGFAGDGDDSDRDEDGKKAEQFGNGSQKGHFISRTCIETTAKVKTRKCSLPPIHFCLQ